MIIRYKIISIFLKIQIYFIISKNSTFNVTQLTNLVIKKSTYGLFPKILAFQKMVHPTIHHRTIGGA